MKRRYLLLYGLFESKRASILVAYAHTYTLEECSDNGHTMKKN